MSRIRIEERSVIGRPDLKYYVEVRKPLNDHSEGLERLIHLELPPLSGLNLSNSPEDFPEY